MSMVNLNTLESQKKKAEEEKEANIVEAQIEVYEGQTYVARDAYAEAKAKRGKSRAKLPEKIPEDSTYKEQMLQSQMMQVRMIDPKQRQQVDEYQTEIKKQQKAKETTRILDEQMPALFSQAEQEVESVKEAVYVTAKETATKTQNALIQSYSTQIKAESERRSAEMKAVHDKHQAVESPWKNGYYERDGDSRLNSWKRKTKKAYDNEIISVRMSHLKADGFSLAVDPYGASTGIGDAIERGIVGRDNVHTVRDSTLRYSLELIYAGQDISTGKIGVSEYNQRIAQAKSGQTALVEKNRLAGAQSRAKAMASARIADSEYWDNVVETNWSVVTANQKKVDSLGLDHNVADLSSKRLSTIYNVGDLGELTHGDAGGTRGDKQLTIVDMMKAGFLPNESTVGVTSTATGFARRADSPVNGMTLDTSPKATPRVSGLTLDSSPVITGSYNSNPILNQTGGSYTSKQTDSKDYQMNVKDYTANVYSNQRETERGNEQQKMFTNELRKGNIGVIPALLNPQTPQKYYGTGNPRNLKTFLAERGYDISNPNSIPDSVLMSPEKYTDARNATKARDATSIIDLRTKAPFFDGFNSSGAPTYSYPLASPEVQKTRLDAQQKKWDGFGISGVYEGITVPADKYYNSNSLLSEPVSQSVPNMLAPAPKQKQSSENITAVVKPSTWTFNNQSFTSKDKLDAYVKSRTEEAIKNTKANQLLNEKNEFTWGDKKINKVGTLNTEGYINAVKYGESYNSNPLLSKGNEKSVTNASKTLAKTDSSNIPSNYTGNIFSVTDSVTGITKQFRKEERATEYVNFVNNKNNPLPPKPQWVVSSDERVTIPKMGGGQTFTVVQKENVFDSLAEANAFDKAQKFAKSSGDYNSYSVTNLAHSVREGLVKDPTTWQGQTALKFSQAFEPMFNTGKSVNNMVGGKEMAYTETVEEKLISGTLDDIGSGNPFKGTGVKSAWEELSKDPSRFAVQIPATAVMYIGGGKVISLGSQGVKKGIGLLSTHLDNVGMSGGRLSTPAIITKDVGVAINTGVKTVTAVPMKVVKAGYQKVDNYMIAPPTFKIINGVPVNDYLLKQSYGITKQGVISVDKKLNVFQDSRVGLGAKAFYVVSPSGKLHVRQVTGIAETASKSVFDDTGNLIIKDSVKQDYKVTWTGKDYAEISTPDKVIQITRGKTSVIPKEEGTLTNNSVLQTTGRFDGFVSGAYIGSGGKPFISKIKLTPFPKLIPKEADTLKWRMFKGVDIDLRTSPRQPSVPSGLVKPMEINYYTTKAGLRDRIPSILNRPRQFKTSIEEISVISNPTKRTWLLESAQNSPKMTSASTPTPLRTTNETPYQNMPLSSSTGKDILIPVKNQFTKTIEVRGKGLETLGLKNAKIISTQRVMDTPKPYNPYTELIPKEGLPKNKWDLIPKEGLPKKPKLDNKPYPNNNRIVDGVVVESFVNKRVLQSAIDSGKITYIGKRTSITAEEALQSGAGKQYGDNIFKKISTGQRGKDTQVYQTPIKTQSGNPASIKLNIAPLGKFKTIDPYGTTKVVNDLNTPTGMPPVKSSVGKKKSVEEPIGMSGSRGDGTITKQLSVNEKSKSATSKTFNTIDDLKTKPKKKYGSEMKSPYSSAYIGSAVITEVVNDVTQIPPLGRIKDKNDTRISGKLDTGLGVKTDTQGKIDTIVDPRLIQEPIIRQQPRIKNRTKISPISLTGSKAVQNTAQVQMVDMITPMKTFSQSSRTKPKGGFVWIPEGKAQEKTLKRKRGKKAGFIGNVRLDNVMGMYKRKEITYGAKKVTKLERQDARLTSGTSNRIAQPASGLLKTKKKKKEKKTSVFGGGKDEFKGFGSKKKGKKKSSLFG